MGQPAPRTDARRSRKLDYVGAVVDVESVLDVAGARHVGDDTRTASVGLARRRTNPSQCFHTTRIAHLTGGFKS